jgi:nucleotide-binding universal stress UspA family protein
MIKTVIWATDGSEGADIALQEALHLAKLSGGRVIAIHCDHRLHGRAAAYPALADEEDRRIKLRRQVDELKADGVDIELVIRRSHREAADVVSSIATEIGGDVIV